MREQVLPYQTNRLRLGVQYSICITRLSVCCRVAPSTIIMATHAHTQTWLTSNSSQTVTVEYSHSVVMSRNIMIEHNGDMTAPPPNPTQPQQRSQQTASHSPLWPANGMFIPYLPELSMPAPTPDHPRPTQAAVRASSTNISRNMLQSTSQPLSTHYPTSRGRKSLNHHG